MTADEAILEAEVVSAETAVDGRDLLATLPPALADRKQFCARVDKRPFVQSTRGKLSPKWTQRSSWLTLEEAISYVGTEIYEGTVSGVGYLVSRNDEKPDLLGGDLDCCRDPTTGVLSEYARDLLLKIKPFYTEVSPSECGIRFFVYGNRGGDPYFEHGPQDDLSEETRARIIERKPGVQEKLDKGRDVWNGLELYTKGRHLSITGDKVPELCFAAEDRSDYLPISSPKKSLPETGSSPSPGRGGLPPINILDVVDTRAFKRSGGQLKGPHPTLGSTSGENLVINPKKNIYAYMHDEINKGGDAWVYLACECGAVRWEDAGKGCLRDSKALEQTLRHAVKRGLVDKSYLPPGDLDEALELVKDLPDRTKKDVGAAFEPEALEALATIRDKNPAEWVRLRKELKKIKAPIGDLDRLTAKKLNERKEAESRRKAEVAKQKAEAEATEDIPEADPEVIAEARDILENGDPVGFAMGVFSSLHMGDKSAGKLVYCCQLTPHILNSKGLHPKASGDSGKGKSDLFEAVLHTLPAEWWLKASLSSKALFYNDIKPGTVIFCDDYQQNDDIDTIIKQATSRFHQPYYHLTVDRAKGGLVGRKLPIPEALVWAITSIDPDQDIQVLNRAVPLDVDDSFEADKAVADHVLEQAINGGDDLPETEEVLVCREMFRILKSESVRVKIPFADRIIWRDPTNRRNLPMFLDILRALTFWHRFQREVVDDYLLATEKDFEDAKVLYCGERRSDTFKSKLSARERDLAELIVNHGGELSRQEAAKLLGVTPNRIDQLTRGKRTRAGDRRGGLSDKLTGFDIEHSNDTKWGATGTGKSKTVKSTVFKLESFDVWGDVERVVSLSHEPRRGGRNLGTPREPKKEPPIGTPITTHKREREYIEEPSKRVGERVGKKKNNSPTPSSSVERVKGFYFSFSPLSLKTKKKVPLGEDVPTDSDSRGSLGGSLGVPRGYCVSPGRGSYGFEYDLLDPIFSEDYLNQVDREADEVAARHQEAEAHLAALVAAL